MMERVDTHSLTPVFTQINLRKSSAEEVDDVTLDSGQAILPDMFLDRSERHVYAASAYKVQYFLCQMDWNCVSMCVFCPGCVPCVYMCVHLTGEESHRKQRQTEQKAMVK